MKKQEINIGYNSYLNVQTSQLVSLHETLTVIDGTNPIELTVKIEADFNTIPKEYHEIFFNILSSKYHGKASFGDNPFSQCLPPVKKRWWQFWKAR